MKNIIDMNLSIITAKIILFRSAILIENISVACVIHQY